VGWEVLGLPRAGALLADSQGQVNQVAAVPSLHTAFAVLVCLVLLPLVRRRWQRLVLIGYPPVMALVLVWSGEHYVIDTVLGAVYAGAVVCLATRGWPALARATRHRLRTVRPWTATPTVDA
jgi:membrane-associated phospholipid phosphatase